MQSEQMDRLIPQRMKQNLQEKFQAVVSNLGDIRKLKMQENIPDNQQVTYSNIFGTRTQTTQALSLNSNV